MTMAKETLKEIHDHAKMAWQEVFKDTDDPDETGNLEYPIWVGGYVTATERMQEEYDNIIAVAVKDNGALIQEITKLRKVVDIASDIIETADDDGIVYGEMTDSFYKFKKEAGE